MNKKKLPRAIRPTAARTRRAGPALDTTASAHPADHHPSEGRREATVATETTGSEEPGKDASTVAKDAASPDATETTPDGRRAKALKLVERYSLWSGAAGLIPVPFVDLAAVGGVQIQMLRRISQIYSVPFSENRGKALIASLAGSMIPASSGIGAASIIKSVPIIGMTISAIVMPALSAGAAYAIGMVFIQHFTSGGTLLDFNPRDYREFIKAQKAMWSTRSGTGPTATKSAPAS
jgi:uncharacterized protein (DUF697 family)